MPVRAEQTGSRNGSWSIRRAGDLKINDVLVHALSEEHGASLDCDALMPEVLGDDEGEAFDLEPFFDAVSQQAANVPGFSIVPRWVLGNFAFQKMAIVKDLQSLGDPLAVHDLIAGIAGDAGAAQLARGDRSSVDPSEFDREPPDQEFLVRDADSSQQQAIAATLRGQNGVISGPPGTGKSQTISNLIAEAVARGKTVLFVAEKRAALDVVLNRLKEADLGHLCLDCHGAELTRRHVAEQLQTSIERAREAPVPDAEALHRSFTERRDRLNAHVRALHQVRQPGGLSVYALYGRILRLSGRVTSTTRLPSKVLSGLDERAIADCAQAVRELASRDALVTQSSASPWNGASITSSGQLRDVVEHVRRLAREHWPAWEAALSALLSECPVKPLERTADVGSLLTLLSAIQHTLSMSDEGLFQADLNRLLADLAPAKSTAGAVFAALFNGAYRKAVRDVKSLHRGPLSGKAALALVQTAIQQRSRWRTVASDRNASPHLLTRLDAAVGAWSAVQEDLRVLDRAFLKTSNDDRSLAEVGELGRRLAEDGVTPAELLRIHELEEQLKARGVEPVLAEIRSRKLEPATWPDLLRSSWALSCLDEIQLQDPSVSAFKGNLHDEIAAEFRRLDKERLAVAVQRVQRAHAVAAVETRNKYPAQSTLVAKEAAKRARHLPLRRLFSEAPDVMLALRPCWMASPLSVSHLIPGERPLVRPRYFR